MLIDDVTIKLQAGKGGRGAVAFSTVPMTLGPTGGNGGKGGDIYFEGVADIGILAQFRFKKEIEAENGHNGKRTLNDGRDGFDVILKIPVGTVVHNQTTGTTVEITKVGERVLAVAGGKGGWGNWKFRSSTNTTPMDAAPGLAGEHGMFRLQLKLIADVGLIGLPNVGKSSLLNELTKARAKIANYQFTTLEPNLGAYFDLILADIPGLIEGASKGKGLGYKFLKHIERTGILFHLVSATSEDPVADYKTVREELKKYNPSLVEKQEYVFLSRTDEVTPEEIKTKLASLKKAKIVALPLSILDADSINQVKNLLTKIADEK